MAAILDVVGLTKYYRHNWTMRRFCVLDRLDLRLEEGEIFGLIGPNGAGKTTTFKVILGLLRPASGAITFRGRSLDATARAAIGFLPEQPYFYDYLSVEETLSLYARLYGMGGNARHHRVHEVVERLQLGDKQSAPLRTLSKGTLQRVGVAQAILNHPQLVILDEPMSGLDPAGRHHMRELVLSLRREGATVIFSSHILSDTEVLCDRVGILTQGRLQEIVKLRDLDGAAEYQMTVRGVAPATLAELERIAGHAPTANRDSWCFRLPGQEAVGAALGLVCRGTGSVESLVPVHPSLEERFLTHVGHAPSLD